MKHLLNTLFFGYLPLKWRRLIRTIFTMAYLTLVVCIYIDGIGGIEINEFNFSYFYLIVFIPIISIALISWVVKPFVVK